MIYFTNKNDGLMANGHIGSNLIPDCDIPDVYFAQADGDELQRACEILGRPLPNKRVYTFIGDNAREIAINWY